MQEAKVRGKAAVQVQAHFRGHHERKHPKTPGKSQNSAAAKPAPGTWTLAGKTGTKIYKFHERIMKNYEFS